MLIFDCLKKEVKSKIVFQFMKNKQKPQYIEILNFKKNIEDNIDKISFDFSDLSINSYKIYDCKTKFTEKEVTNSISIYYDQTNYINCGEGGQHSAEIIFSDFISKSLEADKCFIEYDGMIFKPIEDFGTVTRKRINFINIDFHKIKFPKDINDKDIKIDTKDNKNFLISISMIDKPKIIAIYLNNPFMDFMFDLTEKEVSEILDSALENIRKIVYLNEDVSYEKYYERGTKEILNEYAKQIKNSYEIEKKISKYFLSPREKLSKEQIDIYEKYSEFMAYFPDIGKQDARELEIKNKFRYYNQFYYSKISLNEFYKTIPNDLDESDRAKLKYAASRCLRTLLITSDGENCEKLFTFADFTEPNNIYSDAVSFNKKFVQKLTEKSEIFLFFLQLISGSSINLLNNEFMSRISMLNAEIIKDQLISTIPKYGIRVLPKTRFNACSYNDVRITCINEDSFFGMNLSNKELTYERDKTYNRRYKLANLLQHEDFGHINNSINFYAFYDKNISRTASTHYSENLSPFKYYMVKEKKMEIQEIVEEVEPINKKSNGEIIIKGESGIALTFFLTRGKYQLMKLLKKNGIDFTELFLHPELQASEDLTDYINELNKLYNDNTEQFELDGDNNIEYTTRFQKSKDARPIAYGIPTLEKFH